MGLMDKIKNLFSDEIEEEVKPVKKEVIQVEIPSPKKEDIEKDITESEAIKKDEKFVFPVYFDDKDFDTLDYKPKTQEAPKTSGYALNKTAPKEDRKDKKVFKPSPVISPVYGILDKNYSKDDIVTKSNQKVERYQSFKEITVDDVRKKAFGTLEEDLETELFSQNSMLFNDKVEEEATEKDLFEELEEAQTDDNKEVIEEEVTLDLFEEVSETDETYETEENDDSNMISNELDKMFDEEDTLTEGDLFNLIDSMYEKGEDK